MPPAFTGAVRDSLSNLAASLGAGKDKAASDRFLLVDLDRGQVEAMVRGDWLARKVVDIVPYWLGSSKGSADRVDQIVSMLHESIGGSADALRRKGRA